MTFQPDISSDAERILERITDAFFALDRDWRFTYINREAERAWGRTREALLGRGVWGEFPEAVGSRFDLEFRRAVAEQATVSFEEFYPPLDAWLEVRLYPSVNGLSVFFQDVSERRQAQDVLRTSEVALREKDAGLQDAQERLEAALTAGGVDAWTWDLAADHSIRDPSFEAIHPEDRPRVIQAVANAVDRREAYEAEYRVVQPDGSHRWLSARGRVARDTSGQPIALQGASRDITEQVERERRVRFLRELAERARTFADPDEVIADAVASIGRFLGVSRCLFADIDIEADTCRIRPDYCADPSVASMKGVVSIAAFGAFVVAEYAARRAVAVDDVHLDPIKAPPETIAAYEAVGILAHVTVPVVHFDRIVSCISVHNATPRHWAPEEIELLRAAVERTWLTVEVLRQQSALAREAEALREAHQRTAGILESITDAFFALDRDWRFTYINDQGETLLQRKREELLGRNVWDEFPEAVGSSFDRQYHRAVAEQVAVFVEEFFPSLETWFDVRAYPSSEGLAVYFHDISERKALEEAQGQIAEREHRIAEQLQAALQPDLPGTVPGLAVTKYYEAALTDQAGVGGDFYDVFSVEKGCTALVVGDLSGKGLQAAAQVSIVRNMLRAFLYSQPTVADAVTSLNRVLAENNLLTGFSTLFVGSYDSGTRELRFVNCGQEPALVRRAATTQVEQLAATGPILGSMENAEYMEETVQLAPGDALAIFSDGMTECGPSRREMLGVEGVGALFSASAAAGAAVERAGQFALHLIAGVDAVSAGGVMRDDVCLLVAVAE